MLLQEGEFESSKSAMNPRAPELSALMTILRLVGPVISTRRSCSASGTGATVKSSGAGDEVERLAGVEPRLELLAGVEQLEAACVELLVQTPDERERVVRQRLVVAVLQRCAYLHPITSSSASCR